MSFADNKPTRPVMPLMSDVAKRREWLTAQHIDKQMAGGWLDMFAYELPPEEGADWSRYLKHAVAVVLKRAVDTATQAPKPQ